MCYFGSCQDKSFFFLTRICKGREGGEWLELKLAFKKSEKKRSVLFLSKTTAIIYNKSRSFNREIYSFRQTKYKFLPKHSTE